MPPLLALSSAPPGRLTHPPHTTPAETAETAFPESNPKSARRTTQHSCRRNCSCDPCARPDQREHGSYWMSAAPNPRTFHIPVVHGWNAPMPTEGDNPNNAWIEHALQTVTQKLARGLSLLMTHATQRSSEDRVLVHHEAITEYLTSSSNGHAFPTKVLVDQLMEALRCRRPYILPHFIRRRRTILLRIPSRAPRPDGRLERDVLEQQPRCHSFRPLLSEPRHHHVRHMVLENSDVYSSAGVLR